MLRRTCEILCVLTALGGFQSACAQVASHSQDYVIHVPPFMSLDALRGEQFMNHPQTGGDLTFTNSIWWARTSSATGSTVLFSTDHAFQNESDPAYRRDVRLRSPRMFVTPGAGWKYDRFVDQTDYAVGDEVASVQVSSSRSGSALIYLEVTFLTGDLATLKGGDYVVTVVGTISEN